jgi:hypothetical protein
VKAITLLAVAAMLLVEVFGSKASVGGSMSFMLVFVLVMLAVAIFEAWSNKRGAVGWIVNLFASAVGGLVAVALIGSLWRRYCRTFTSKVRSRPRNIP